MNGVRFLMLIKLCNGKVSLGKLIGGLGVSKVVLGKLGRFG